MQADATLRNYTNAFHAVYRIVIDEGGLALWKGAGPTVVRAMALNMSVEFFKVVFLGANIVSGFFAAACSLPFDYVKTQIQKMQPDAEGKYPYTGSFDCAMKTLKSGGPFKFYTRFPLMSWGIPTSKEEFYALRASLFRLSKEANDSPVLATAYNDMFLAINDLFSLHKMTKDSHDEAVTALQHLESLRQEKNHIQTSFNEGTYSSVMTTHLPVDPVAQLLSDILMDLQSEDIAVSVTQEVLSEAEHQPEDTLAADT
ncbi:hypothetical protein RND71_040458 [Anisodus tanguticus]|uniref:Uncharacterized protein n=1 Tax=Anisodus tanguticus TaxID=243964 RepID=A0AAE1UTC6_9SOLA|nr:hypothetical protein RND71_040458 [Anisodus tanguticus]